MLRALLLGLCIAVPDFGKLLNKGSITAPARRPGFPRPPALGFLQTSAVDISQAVRLQEVGFWAAKGVCANTPMTGICIPTSDFVLDTDLYGYHLCI